jgi:hypothetical protein
MAPPNPLTAYVLWVALVAGGALLASADRRWGTRPLLGVVLVVGVVGGFVVTKISPFDFVTGGYYLQGALVSAGAALALIGYVLATVWHFTHQLIRGRRRPPKP